LPIFQILLHDKSTHVRVQVEDAGPVNVEDGVEAMPVPVEEVLGHVLQVYFLIRNHNFDGTSCIFEPSETYNIDIKK
jgi:hypothetical protein